MAAAQSIHVAGGGPPGYGAGNMPRALAKCRPGPYIINLSNNLNPPWGRFSGCKAMNSDFPTLPMAGPPAAGKQETC